MKKLFVLLTLLTAILAIGCEKEDTPATEGDAPKAESGKTVEDAIKFANVRVTASQTTLRMEGSPKPKDVEKQLVDELYKLSFFDEDGDVSANISVTYDIREITKRDGTKALDAVVFGDIKTVGLEQQRRFKSEVRTGNAVGETKNATEMIASAVTKFVQQIDAQAQVESATPEQLVKLIEEGNTVTAKKMAIQEARERQVKEAIPSLRKSLEDEDTGVKIAASGALVTLSDGESYSKIIKVAEDLSRDKNPDILALVYLIGQMGTDESRTYLEALAGAHPAAPVREAAKNALAKNATK